MLCIVVGNWNSYSYAMGFMCPKVIPCFVICYILYLVYILYYSCISYCGSGGRLPSKLHDLLSLLQDQGAFINLNLSIVYLRTNWDITSCCCPVWSPNASTPPSAGPSASRHPLSMSRAYSPSLGYVLKGLCLLKSSVFASITPVLIWGFQH